MIDPASFTCYTLDEPQLEEYLLFAVCVAGKNAVTTARALNNLLAEAHASLSSPFLSLRIYPLPELQALLKRHGIGCHGLKARGIYDLVRRDFDLRTVPAESLETVPGIGPKTARFFILHTRRDAQVAALDTHMLKFMRDLGLEAPKTTPGSGRQYRKWELTFMDLAKKANMAVADFDLEIWKAYSRKDKKRANELLLLVR